MSNVPYTISKKDTGGHRDGLGGRIAEYFADLVHNARPEYTESPIVLQDHMLYRAVELKNQTALTALLRAALFEHKMVSSEIMQAISSESVVAVMHSSAKSGKTKPMQICRKILIDRKFSIDYGRLARCAAAHTASLLVCLEWTTVSDLMHEKICISAAKHGNIEVVDMFLRRDGEMRTRLNHVLLAAAANGCANVVLFAINSGAEQITGAAIEAARNGHINVVTLCLYCGVSCYDIIHTVARDAGHNQIAAMCKELGGTYLRAVPPSGV